MKMIRLISIAAALLGFAGVAMAQSPPITPPYSVLGGQTLIAASTTTSSVQFPAQVIPYGAVTLYNYGSADICFALGGSSVTAAINGSVCATGSTLLAASTYLTLWVNSNTWVAAITFTSTSNLVVYQGTGPLQFGQVGGSGGSGAGVSSFNARTGNVISAGGDYSVAQVTGAAPLASPALTGNPTAPTQTSGDSSTKLATTAFVKNQSYVATEFPITVAGNSIAANGSLAATTLANSLPEATTSQFGVIKPDGTTITCSAGVCSSTGAVASVSNTDGSLVFSPTTGVVHGSLNTAHANTFSAAQTFGSGDLVAPNVVVGTGTLTFPANTNDTVVTLAASQTLLSKSLTSPGIAGGALSGTFSGAATFSGNLTFTGLNAYGTPASLNLANASNLPAASLSGIVPSANGGGGSLTGIGKFTAGVTSVAVAGTDYAAPGAVDPVATNVNAATMGARFATQNTEQVTGSSVTVTYPVSTSLLANGANFFQAIGGAVGIATDASDQLCVPNGSGANCGTAGAGGSLPSGYGGLLTTDQNHHLYLSEFVESASGGGFPITLGSTSIASSSTTTIIAGLTLSGPTLSGTVAGTPTFSGNVTFSGAIALGTPASGVATNLTGYQASNLTGLGTGVATALGNNIGSAGAPVTFNGAGGTPSSLVLTNASGTPSSIGLANGTGLPISGIASLGSGVATALGNATNAAGGFCVLGANGCAYKTATIGWVAAINPNNTGVLVFPAASTIVSIVGNVETAVGSTATVSVNLASSGTACSAGTTVHSGSFNANGTAATNQTLTLTTTAASSGQRLCLQTTGTTDWTGGAGIGTITVAYTTP
jgi:hypothetical protein